MADGLNQARAMRVAELMTDFRNVQVYMAAIRVNPSAAEYNEIGYTLLRRCIAESQALLAQPFNTQAIGTRGDLEEDKAQLRRIIVDAAVRRFRAQRIYLKTLPAMRWIQNRTAILQGKQPGPMHAAALNAITESLRAELLSVTDQRVDMTLRNADVAAGKWLVEDPSLSVILRCIAV